MATIASKKAIFTVGFAAESENLIQNAKEKLTSKKIDLIVANLIQETMGQSVAKVTIINKNNEILDIPKGEKKNIAFEIMKQIHFNYSKEVVNEYYS